MSWRTVVITKSSKLDYSLSYLIVRNVEKTSKVHLGEVNMLIIESNATSISAVLLNELAQRKIAVVFCDGKKNPHSQILPLYGCHDCSQRLKNQLGWNEEIKKSVWTEIVRHKIINQAQVLHSHNIEQCDKLFEYAGDIHTADSTNREGHAAKVYFNALFSKDFTREKECPQNAMLNYGYSILLSCFNREVVASGYLTQLGLFHNNQFNQFNLSCDLMEVFRPLVDNIVYKTNPQKFDKEEKAEVLGVLNNDVIINTAKNTVLNAVKIYCKSVFKALEENDISSLRFPEYEL